jgi:PIN domain nuclease of toxin-antitoxin system
MRLLLDTVTLIRAVVSPQLISRKAFASLQSPENVREVSSISLSELAIKHGKGKLTLTKEDVLKAVADLQLQILPYTKDHALTLFDLPWHHTDPFDRQIIAQAIAEGIPVVTSDEEFRLYKELTVIW